MTTVIGDDLWSAVDEAWAARLRRIKTIAEAIERSQLSKKEGNDHG